LDDLEDFAGLYGITDFNPLVDNKFNVYDKVFADSPGSSVAGADPSLT